MKRIDFYEIEIEGKLVKFFPKLTEWSDAYHKVFLFSGGDFPKFSCLRKGYKPPIRVKDFNTGKLNRKLRLSEREDNFIDPAQGRVTGATYIWNDHHYIVDLADELEPLEKNCRDDTFKWFGKIISYAVVVDNSSSIPHEFIVDFEPQDTIVKAIMGKIVSGHMKFIGMNEIFEMVKIGSIDIVIENDHRILKISSKDELQKGCKSGVFNTLTNSLTDIQNQIEAEMSSYIESKKQLKDSANNTLKIEEEIKLLEDTVTGCEDNIASLENQLDIKKKQVGFLKNQCDMKKKELEEEMRRGKVLGHSADNNKKLVHELIEKLMNESA